MQTLDNLNKEHICPSVDYFAMIAIKSVYDFNAARPLWKLGPCNTRKSRTEKTY